MAQDPGTATSAASSNHTPTPVQLLPIDKVFPIQIGSEMFRISGNALNSDSPSYFTQFFTTNSGDNLKTLYIDRDPVIFKDIVRHLQGYLLTPRNEEHFVYLYSDAIYYRLPRLRQRLFRDFYVRIGDTSFQIPRELFNDTKQKGDGKNFFSMGFGSAMGSPFPDDKMFPQLNMENFDAEKQLRPPYMIPPKLSRSSAHFNDILNYMEGYEIDIKSDLHRRNLIKDARFYNLRHLSELLIPTRTHHNPFRGNASEILLSLNDFRPPNCRIVWPEGRPFGWLEYQRPHDIDTEPRDLVVQIDDDGMVVGGGRILLISRQAIKGVITLKETAESKKSEAHPNILHAGREEIAVRIEIPSECHCMFDGEEQSPTIFEPNPVLPVTTSGNGDEISSPAQKRRRINESDSAGVSVPAGGGENTKPSGPGVHILKRSLWRVKVKGTPPPPSTNGIPAQPPAPTVAGGRRTMVLVAVKLEGWTREKEFTKEISWL